MPVHLAHPSLQATQLLCTLESFDGKMAMTWGEITGFILQKIDYLCTIAPSATFHGPGGSIMCVVAGVQRSCKFWGPFTRFFELLPMLTDVGQVI